MRTTIFSIYLTIFFSISASAQTTSIPDPAFEQRLIDAGYDSDGVINGQVLTSDIDDVVNLSVSFAGIEDLTGIEDFESLVFLEVNFNDLTTLDLSQNLNILTIFANNNQLTSVDVSTISGLHTLFVSNNQLTSLEFIDNPAMHTLQCANNQLTSINAGNTIWTSLNCSFNPLTEIDLSENEELQFFIGMGCDFTTLDLSGKPDMTEIVVPNNDLTYIDVRGSNNTGIETFDASANPALECVAVDDPAYSEANWTQVSSEVTFSLDCGIDPTGCPEDLNGDLTVDIEDFLVFNSFFGANCQDCPADIDGSGAVEVNDFILFNSAFGESCD